jgi:serine/threonine protein kinase
MAPELIKKEEYTESVDIWSLGIILVELCEG